MIQVDCPRGLSHQINSFWHARTAKILVHISQIFPGEVEQHTRYVEQVASQRCFFDLPQVVLVRQLLLLAQT